MQVFKCKMCGGMLNIENGATVAECEFCGRKQTIPKLDDEKRANLYDRANHFRRNNDYDKAMGIYELILNEDKTDAEAYWSILLCKYGVEYVEDPSSHKRIPTINRTQFTSILKDADYKNALKYADGYQRDIYEEEAKEIDKIQKGILSISGKEEPFDVFICYKETDYSGRRTIDSVLAQELYSNLKNEGFKVFFSRITLEDKLGVAYEPYIFAALNSAKVMVVLGSKREHFDAVWVKNEWSRYLSLIRNGEKKTLIPAYKDMDPYDLPEDFAHLQAQDMNKLGAMQDLVYGIKKIVERSNPKSVIREMVIRENPSHDKSPLIRRAYLFLEDGDFQSSDDYAEKILDMDPECAEAYLIKLLSELQVCTLELLSQFSEDISQNAYYKKAIRFADKGLNDKLIDCRRQILENIEKNRKERIYQSACNAFINERYQEAIEYFSEILDYKDSVSKINECNECMEIERKERIYNTALLRVSSSNTNDAQIKASISDFQSILDYKDSEEKVAWLQARLEKYYYDKKVAEEQAKIRAEEERLRKLREAEICRINAEKRKEKIKKIARIGVPSTLALVLILVLTFTLFIPLGKYNKANDLLNAGKYEEATSIYEELDGFGGSNGKIATINAVQTINGGSIEKGIRNALNAGIKVNLTYEFNGGQFSQAVMSNMIRLSSPSTTNETESEKTYTFTKVSDFTGFKSPKRNGYDFIKWTLVSCLATVSSNDNAVNVRLMATWEAKEYSISYELNGGSLDTENPIGYNPDEPFTLINPTKKGYTFLGWTGTDLTSETLNVSVHKGSYGDREYTANWQANTYVVTYDANGGTSSQTQDIAIYDKEFVLTKAERKGYTFLGWFYGAIKCEDFDKWELTNGISLVANWQAISYTITYNLNGGNATNVLTYTIEDSINIPTPTKKGYSFDGWTGTDLTEKTQNVCLPKGTTGDKTFNANWTANNYTLSFDVNGGDELVNKSKNVTYDETYSLPVPTRIGYDFIKWETNTGTVYSGGTWETANNVTLIAQWKAKEYTVTYNGNGGTPTQNDVIVAYDSDFIPTTANRTGYDFVCWKYNGVKFSGGKWELTTNITLIAEWSPKTYTITYMGNGGTSSANSQTVTYDSYPILATAERTGYTFKGWYNGSNKYTSGNQWKTANNIILTAEWTANTNTPYTVKHYQQNVNDNGYTLFDTQDFTGTSDASISPAVMTYTGFTSPSKQTTTISPDGSKTVEYYYTRNSYTITLISNGGTGSSITQKYQSNLDKTNWTTRNGFTFGGWFTDKDLTTEYTAVKMPAQNQTLYAWWTEENKPTDFSYIEDSGITISIYLGNATSVRVPAYIGGLEVKTIGASAFANKTTIEEIHIPQTITTIGDSAFSGCSSINRFNSSNDNTLVIPISVASIGESAFDGFTRIVNIEVPFVGADTNSTENFKYAFGTCAENIKCVTITNDIDIPASAFEALTQLEETIVSDITQTIGNSAFRGCSSLKRIALSKNTKEIGAYAFSSCAKLSSVMLPNGLEKIGKQAFLGTSLNLIEIPSSVTSIGEEAFRVDTTGFIIYCEAESKPSGWDRYWNVDNYSSGVVRHPVVWNYVKSDDIYYTLEENSATVTRQPRNLTNIIIPSKITYNGTIYPVTKIGEYAFSNCTNLVNIENPKSLLNIDDFAFKGCVGLTTIEIPNSVTTVGASAFSECINLEYVVLYNNITSIGQYAFSGCDKLTIYCEVESQPSEWDSNWNQPINGYACPVVWGYQYIIQNGTLYGIKNEQATVIRQLSDITNVTILPAVKYKDITYPTTTIGTNAFANNTNLLTVNLPSSITNIGQSAFSCCINLKEINIPTSVTTIGFDAFNSCKSLESIIIPNNVISIGDQAFSDCVELVKVEFVAGSKCASIGNGVFQSCVKLMNINIPTSLTTIGVDAFNQCSSLTDIVIPNSEIIVQARAFAYCNKLAVYCELGFLPNNWDANWNPSSRPVYWYSEDTPSLNAEGTAYDGNYWRYVDGVPTAWVYAPEE